MLKHATEDKVLKQCRSWL